MSRLVEQQLAEKFPPEVNFLFKIFGDDIRLVGGCVRDLLLGKKIADFDFATRFLPEEMLKILQKNGVKAVPTGLKFGTITAVVDGKNFEITTLREDSKTNGRHCKPQFLDDYFSDAKRRDFTINALYLDAAGRLYDYFDGISDLKNQKVRFIGKAEQRITEDFLRILRFFRFSCDYALSLDQEGLQACIQQKENLKKLSRERIRAEFLKILASENKANLITVLEVLESQKIFEQIFFARPDIKALAHLFEIEKKLKFSASSNLKLACLFLQNGFALGTHPESRCCSRDSRRFLEVFAQEICATNSEKKYFQTLLDQKNLGQKNSPPDLEELKQFFLFEKKELILDFFLLDLAKNFDSLKFSNWEEEAEKKLQFLQNFSLPIFPLNGHDAMQLGFKDKAVGEAIKLAKNFWAENDFKADKIALVNFLKTHLKTEAQTIEMSTLQQLAHEL